MSATDPNAAEGTGARRSRRVRSVGGVVLFVSGLGILAGMLLLLRLGVATDYLYHSLVKDPPRVAPTGNVMVSPADGVVIYVREIRGGVIPEVVKRGVPVPVVEQLKTEPLRPFRDGYLIGIYMNTQGVHLNYLPDSGILRKQYIFNGPHMDMTEAEARIILTQMVPGLVTLKKLLGLPPYRIEDKADFVLDSARETLAIEDARGSYMYIVRIADYYVGKILTWVDEGESVVRGQKLGMITWGSQTDLFIEKSPGLSVEVAVGEYVYGGETVVASY